jgi:hypothetical protein
MNEKNTTDCSHDFFYLCNKFKIIEERHKNILYFILNRCNYSKPKNNPIHYNFQMITSLYNEKNIDRAMELLLVLSQNLQNKNIQTIHVLFENNGNSRDNLIRTVVNVILIRNKLYENLKIVNIKQNDILIGNTVIKYKGPNPPKDSGKHHYIFSLFRQHKFIDPKNIVLDSRFIELDKLFKMLKTNNNYYTLENIKYFISKKM